MPDAVMLFTAGLGTRMGDLTRERPKPLIEVAGRALVDHALDQVAAVAPNRIVANLHYRPDQMRRHLEAVPGLRFSDETETILETGGGLKAAVPLFGSGPVFTLNTDAIWTGPSPLVTLRDHWAAKMEGLLLLIPRTAATAHTGPGDFDIDGTGRIGRGRALVYTGAAILRTEDLERIEEKVFSLNRLWDRMISRGGLYGCVHHGGWCDVGRPEAIPLAEALLAEASHG